MRLKKMADRRGSLAKANSVCSVHKMWKDDDGSARTKVLYCSNIVDPPPSPLHLQFPVRFLIQCHTTLSFVHSPQVAGYVTFR
jgi:hypothetical protein